jgi:hypothetical protein
LQFIIRQLNAEVMFDPRQQIKRLETIDPERLEKIVVWSELLPRHFEMRSRKIQNLVKSVIDSRR